MPTQDEIASFQRRLTVSWIIMLVLTFLLLMPRIRNWAGIELKGEPRPVTARGDLAEYEKTSIAVFKEARPSVVFVNTRALARNRLTRRAYEVEAGTGSGFIWDEQGHIVTNFHVIKDVLRTYSSFKEGSSVHVEFGDQTFEASIINSSPQHDLAVLKIDAPSNLLHPVLIGKSSELEVGQAVFAIGHPYRLGQTGTTGVVSARSVQINGPLNVPIEDVIQIDAAINPGNSGGPLLDSAGRLIGVNTAIYSPSGASAGIGFAIPVDTVNRVVPEIIAEGAYTPPKIGIETTTLLNEWLARRTGISAIVILTVEPDSPAAAAGLRGTQTDGNNIVLGDVIVKVDDQRVTNLNELLSVLDQHDAEDSVTLTILREGQEQTVDVTLE